MKSNLFRHIWGDVRSDNDMDGASAQGVSFVFDYSRREKMILLISQTVNLLKNIIRFLLTAEISSPEHVTDSKMF